MATPLRPLPPQLKTWQEQWLTRSHWLIPLFLLVVLLAPFLRQGMPVTQIGFFVLTGVPDELRFGLLPLNKSGIPFQFALLTLMIGTLAYTFWKNSAWWVTCLWLTLPVTISLLYQRVLPLPLLLWLVVGVVMLNPRTLPFQKPWENMVVRGIGGLILLYTGLSLIGQGESPIAPYQLVSGIWANPDHWRDWISQPGYQIGIIPLVVAVLVMIAALPRRQDPVARDALLMVGVGFGFIVSTLFLPVPVFYFVIVGASCLVLAAGALPVLDARYATLPVQIAILAVALISIYPYLRPAWLDEIRERTERTFYNFNVFGDQELGLFEPVVTEQGNSITIQTHWQALSRPQKDYSVFIHVLDETGTLVAQQDALLVDGDNLSTSQWMSGYIVLRSDALEVKEPYSEIRIGLYDLATLERLLVNPQSSDTPSNFLNLALP